MTANHDQFIGCLLGGAVGDALGAPVEFLSEADIRHTYGPKGITDFDEAYEVAGAITDDTQMALFTAEGLLRAHVRGSTKGICHVPSMVHRSYLRWLVTQEGTAPHPYEARQNDGWLVRVRALHSQRAPGNTCLAALRTGELGSPDKPLNDSKGCGGVMRVAPVGLTFSHNPNRAFELGCDVAAITHGHPSGYLSAGYLAAVIAKLISGATLRGAMDDCKRLLSSWDDHDEVEAAVDAAIATANQGPGSDRISKLGEGWVAEEALAISLYCCLVARDLEEAVILAVNHSGDSDSTGSIVGNIMGAKLGAGAIPPRWAEAVELRDEIFQVARDLATMSAGQTSPDEFETLASSYPPY